MRLLLLGGEAGPVPALPLPGAVVPALVPVALPGPEGDLLLFGVARGIAWQAQKTKTLEMRANPIRRSKYETSPPLHWVIGLSFSFMPLVI